MTDSPVAVTPTTARRPLRRSRTTYIDHLTEAREVEFGLAAGSPPTHATKCGKFFAVAQGKREASFENNGNNGNRSRNAKNGRQWFNSLSTTTSTPHVIAMVGLPARGKTYISKKLSRYLNWIGVNTKVINLGDYRRKCQSYNNHSVFSPANQDGVKMREQIAEHGLADAMTFFEEEEGEVVVFDATNTTRERRKLLHDKVVLEKGYKLFFIESICDDESIIDSNIRSVKVTSPDYYEFNEDQVIEDFKKRIKHYEDQYQTIDEDLEANLSYIKIFDAGEKVLVHKHEGHIQSRIVYYLMNIKITPRTIYLTRHGETYYNVVGKVGGDSGLTARGKQFADLLGDYMNSLKIENLLVWTSFFRRTIQTGRHVEGMHERWRVLNELDVGICDGLTYDEVKSKYPDEFAARDEEKYSHRYPRGESYEDLVARLEPVIMELERQGSVLVIGHQAVLRCILGYFMEVDEDELPYLEVPLHTVMKLEPRAYGCQVEMVKLPVDCVDTHRAKPGTIQLSLLGFGKS